MPDTPTAGPTTRGPAPHDRSSGSPGRLLGLDAARALAIVGMVAVNVGPADLEGGPAAWLYRSPTGHASVLFVLLAGVVFSLMTRRVRRVEDGRPRRAMWASLAWRSALLLLGGLTLQLLPHESNVILAVYAVLFLVAGLLVSVGDRLLLTVAGLSLLGGPVLWLGVQIAGGEPFTGRPSQLTDTPPEVLGSVLLTGPYPLVTWLTPFVLGMWLGRRDLASVRLQRRLAVTAALVVVGTWLVGAVTAAVRGGTVGHLSWELLLTDAPHGQMPLWLAGATALAALILTACLAVGRWRDGEGLLWRALAAAGQLSLTIYVSHLLALALLRPLPHTFAQGVTIAAVICVLAILGAALWRSRFARGPLEALLRVPGRRSSATRRP